MTRCKGQVTRYKVQGTSYRQLADSWRRGAERSAERVAAELKAACAALEAEEQLLLAVAAPWMGKQPTSTLHRLP